MSSGLSAENSFASVHHAEHSAVLQETPGNATCLRRICGHGLGQGLLAKSSGRCPVLPVELPLEGKWEETKKGEKRNHLIPPAQDSHLEHRRPKKE